MNNELQAAICEPAIESWQEAASRNRIARSNATLPISSEEIASLRVQIIEIARNYTSSLPVIDQRLCARSPEARSACSTGDMVVMSGHQPNIFHPGVLYKNQMLDASLARSDAAGLNVIIDTDDGDGGLLKYVVGSPEAPRLDELSISARSGIYMFQKLRAANELAADFRKLQAGLSECGESDAAKASANAAELYAQLAGSDLTAANTAVRRRYQGAARHLEVPFSSILALPEARKFFLALIRDFERFAATYNAVLDAFRSENRIKNAANPFPNLRLGDLTELPFWVINRNAKTRSQLNVARRTDGIEVFSGGESVARVAPSGEVIWACKSECLIVPKAMLTTAFFRVALCDIFVHGRGGGEYDRATNMFLERYFNWHFAPGDNGFVVASASRYLFKRQRSQYEAVKQAQIKRREIQFHVEKYLGEFPDSRRKQLAALAESKRQLIESIKTAKAERRSSADLTQQIKSIEREITDAVVQTFGPAPVFSDVSKPVLEAYYCREFPFFYWQPCE